MSEKIYFSCKREDLRKGDGKGFEKSLKEWLAAFKKELSGVCVWMGSFALEDAKTDRYVMETPSFDALYNDFLSKTRGFSVYEKDGATFLSCDFEDGEACLEGRRLLPDAERRYKKYAQREDAPSTVRMMWAVEMFRSDEDSRPLNIDKAKKNISFDERER